MRSGGRPARGRVLPPQEALPGSIPATVCQRKHREQGATEIVSLPVALIHAQAFRSRRLRVGLRSGQEDVVAELSPARSSGKTRAVGSQVEEAGALSRSEVTLGHCVKARIGSCALLICL